MLRDFSERHKIRIWSHVERVTKLAQSESNNCQSRSQRATRGSKVRVKRVNMISLSSWLSGGVLQPTVDDGRLGVDLVHTFPI